MSDIRAFNLLLVDDDPMVHQSMRLILPKEWKLFSVQKIELLSLDRFYHAALIDMHLSPSTGAQNQKPEGPQVIAKILQQHPQTEVIAISGDLNRELMEACLKVGAQRFLPKPLLPEEVLLSLEKIEALWNLRTHSQSASSASGKISWQGDSDFSKELTRKIAQLRGEMGPVLIQGETGTGKEVVAQLLHEQEPSRPFISVNMASIPENLFESEMFGHVKGAFTGADNHKIGLVEAANGGDLFLDEIEALPLHLQAKLLRFLESGEVRKVGSKDSIQVRTRIITASNRPLREMVASQEFREDLYFRLCTHLLELKPLRERVADIPTLARYFLDNVKPRRNKQFSDDGFESLQRYQWPGNTRELKRICEQLSLTSPLPLIRSEDVNLYLFPNQNLAANSSPASNKGPQKPDFSKGLNNLLADFESQVIQNCLLEHKDIEKAAQLLQISRSSLYKKIKDYKIEENS